MDYIFCVYPISICFLFAAFFMYQPVNGVINGMVTFADEGITINNKRFDLEKINAIDFRFFDYYGDRSHSTGRDFNPKISRGLNNYVTFIDDYGQDQLIYFQLKDKGEYKTLSSFINKAIKAKKMQFKQGVDLVGIEKHFDLMVKSKYNLSEI